MCGILGYVHRQKPVSRAVFSRMLSSLATRGPDGEGMIFADHEKVALGQRRLSIIDLSNAGTQPMMNEDETIWLTVNGEIYNFKKLRRTLETRGHIFRSNSDSEVIIHAYEEWDTDCVHHLQGMFAFGIFDCRNNSLFLARDHFGIKPLYYYSHANRFIFASQPKAILAADDFYVELDHTAFSLYLGYGNVPADHCIYRGIKKLLPGHFLRMKNGKVVVDQYWKLQYDPVITDISEAVEVVREKVTNGIFSQTVSDVPVGTLLSGGVDSTIVTSLLTEYTDSRLSTFSVGFQEEESDERQYARLASDAFQTNHHEYLLTYNEACRLIPDIVEAYDEPFHFNGLFPYYALSKLVKSHDIKVVLGGDGADEIFAGYLWYENFIRDYKPVTQSSLLSRLFGPLLSKKNVSQPDPIQLYFGYNGFLRPNDQRNILGAEVQYSYDTPLYQILGKHWNREFPLVLGAQVLDINCFLVDHCLTKVDRASMACGVEVRVPFLDIDLVNTIFSIDHNLVFFNNERKYLLKKAMHNVLPPKMNTSRKKGFSSPLGNWLEKGMAKAGYSLLLSGSLCENGLLNFAYIKDSFLFLGVGNQLLLISAELWFDRWINNNISRAEDFSREATAYL